LYNADGRNERFIPVVFDECDVDAIPTVLAGATRYNVNRASDYQRLVKRIRSCHVIEQVNEPPRQPGLFDSLSGSGTPRVPDAKIEIARFLLQVCLDGLPIDVLAQAIDVKRESLEWVFANDLGAVLKQPNGTWRVDALSALPEPEDAISYVGRALDGLLAFIKRDRGGTKAEAQILNAVRLAEKCWRSRPKSVAPLFVVVDKLIKRKGDKRLVLRAAELSIAAARSDPLRTHVEVEAEARALVCGKAWVYQRIDKLQEAGIAVEEAEKLGRDVGCSEMSAFCKKCLGRIRRVQAELLGANPAKRAALLNESRGLLRDAIDRFERQNNFGPDHVEVGDCFSLLARTEFEAGDLPAADLACKRAMKMLVDDGTKEWADFQILLGDIAANSDKRAALHFYDDVVDRLHPDDAAFSEVRARAHFRRGIALKKLGHVARAIAEFKLARSIWRGLRDPLASKAEWAELWASDAVDPKMMQALDSERFAVRVKAVQLHNQRLESRRGTYIARKSNLPAAYLEQLKKSAREAVALEEAGWWEDVL
jgi:tetratricopeptide (TPR) repeat protein